jgi:hypothetical protein
MPIEFNQMSKRWHQIETYKVSVDTDTRVVIKMNVSQLYIAAARYYSLYGAFRGSLNLRFECKRIAGSRDILDVMDIGFGFGTYDDDFQTDGGGGIVHPNDKGVLQVTIPWSSKYFISSWYPNQFSIKESCYLYLDSLTTAGTDFCSIKLSACVGDDFHYGIFTGFGVASFYQPINRFTPFAVNVYPRKSTILAPVPEVETIEESGILEYIDRALETTLPIVEKASVLASLLDAHMITYQPYPIQNKSVQYTVACDLPQYTERVLATNHNGMTLPDSECFGTSSNEADIYNLLHNVKSLLGNIAWGQNDITGDLIFSDVVSPITTTAGFIPSDDHVAKIAPEFLFYTGGMRYIFDIISTEMHRGQLLIVFTPASTEDIVYVDATQSYFTTVDLSEGRGTFALDLPYLLPSPYLKIDEPIGKIFVFVQNPLRATATVHPSVDILVYRVAAPDFHFAILGGDKVKDDFIPP